MNKLLTAFLAILMVAGALCAISGATTVPGHHGFAIVGEGSAPAPLIVPGQ